MSAIVRGGVRIEDGVRYKLARSMSCYECAFYDARLPIGVRCRLFSSKAGPRCIVGGKFFAWVREPEEEEDL